VGGNSITQTMHKAMPSTSDQIVQALSLFLHGMQQKAKEESGNEARF